MVEREREREREREGTVGRQSRSVLVARSLWNIEMQGWLRERERTERRHSKETQQVCACCQVTVEQRDAGMVICYVSHRELYTPLELGAGTHGTQ